MKITLEVPDHEASFLLELLRRFSFVKIQNNEEQFIATEQFLQDLGESIDEVKLIKSGVIKGYSLEEAMVELNEP